MGRFGILKKDTRTAQCAMSYFNLLDEQHFLLVYICTFW